MKNSRCTEKKTSLAYFLTEQCEATKAKYAAELANADGEWKRPLEYHYAESLVYFGLLERQTMPIMDGVHVRGSKSRFKRVLVPVGSNQGTTKGAVAPHHGPAQVMAHPGSANGASVQPELF